jgi:SAM-dependent methyltransferase
MLVDGMMDENYSSHTSLADLHYARAIGEIPEMESSKAMATFIAKEYSPGDSIADIGCSSGHYLRSIKNALAKDEIDYTGVEFHELLFSRAKSAWKNDKNANFRQGSIFDIPAKDKEFDITFCSNLLMHVPTIVKPIEELIRITKRVVLIRTYIGTKSFKIQEVKNNSFWPNTEIRPENEFDDEGNPKLFEYENIWGREYFESTVNRYAPNSKIEFTVDDMWDASAIDETAETGNLPNATKTLNGWQIFDYVLLPYHFVVIRL